MCFMDAEPPSVFHAAIHTARKNYFCCECPVVIGRGEKYESAWGVWQGDGETYRTCSRCVELRAMVVAHEELMGCEGTEAIPPFGELRDALAELREWEERELAPERWSK